MEIDDNMINHLAHLARLQFEGEEKAEISKDLSRIVSFVEKLNEVDTQGIEPLIYMTDEFSVAGHNSRLREDEARLEISHEDALKNAPDKDSDYFRVPKVISS